MIRKLVHPQLEPDGRGQPPARAARARPTGVSGSSGTGPVIAWPPRPPCFGELLTPTEAAQYLRLDETGMLTPRGAVRTLNYWRDRGELKATKYARCVWFRRVELDRFLERKTEE